MVVVVVPVHGAGGVGGALASPFGDGEDDGMVVQEENTERLHEVGNGGHHQGSTRYVLNIHSSATVLCFRLHHITIVFVPTRDKIF